MASASDSMRKAVLLELLGYIQEHGVAATYEKPIPDCSAAEHDFELREDETYVEQWLDATFTATPRWSLKCHNCNAHIG